MAGVSGLNLRIALKVRYGPSRSSASNHPPTTRTAHFTFFMCRDRSRDLPVVVVGVVLVLVVEEHGMARYVLVEIGHISGLEIELIAVRSAEIERDFWLGQHRILLRMKERRVETETRREHECSAVIGVVAQKEIGHGRLRAGRGNGRMRVDDRRRGVEPRIGDAPDAHLAVVVGHMLQQELDGVVGIGGIVHIFAAISFRRCAAASQRTCLRSSSARAHPGRQRCSPTFRTRQRGQAARDSGLRRKVRHCRAYGP